MEAIQRLRAVLCDPEGNVCISGSDGDRREIAEGLAELEAQVKVPGYWRNCHDIAEATNKALRSELAAAQATIQQMREALQAAIDGMGGSYLIWSEKGKEALALPADRSCLEAMLAESKSTGFTDGVKFCAAVLNAAGHFAAIKVIRQAAERSE